MRQRTFLLIALSIIVTGMAAQDKVGHDTLQVMDYENPKEYIIADVTVSGIEYIQKEVLHLECLGGAGDETGFTPAPVN